MRLLGWRRTFSTTLSCTPPRGTPPPCQARNTRHAWRQRRRLGTATMHTFDLADYMADSPPALVRLEIEKHFESLTDKQKRYAHFISQASFAGRRIILRQVSPESEHIHDLILALHKSCGGDWKALGARAGLGTEQELTDQLTHFLHYAAQFLGNSGNYKSFGDAKFVPRCPEAFFSVLAEAAGAEAKGHYAATDGAIFAARDKPALMHLGFPEDGHMATYYPDSPGITRAEIEAVSEWMSGKGLMAPNTRLRKTGAGRFELLIASARTTVPADGGDMHSTETHFKVDGSDGGALAGAEIEVVYGDHSAEMARVAALIRRAAENADNETQAKMHLAYAESFERGSLQTFKESQRLWIRDQGPAVESNIGFIETYRDPAGVRGEFEGFAAIVNTERTRAFGELVSSAPRLVSLLPWPKEFETEKFLAPDFTSLEVLTMCTAGIPLGINLPNYDDIKQQEGFKNVSLGNVQNAKMSMEKFPFLRDCDLEGFQENRSAAFEIHVGLHELMGHGCGKFLRETSPGEFNFDKKIPPINPLTGKPITSWYKPGETWGSVFKGLSGAYEECRAELVGLYLICDPGVLKIFGAGDGSADMSEKAGDILYTSYLSMAMHGLIGIEYWDPKSQKWGQPHCRARFAILKTFLDAGDGFCKLEYTKDDLSDLKIHLDRSKILTTGRKAVGDFLRELHIYKSTGDAEAGTRLFGDQMTRVDPEFWGSKVRDVVVKNKQPRCAYVQATTVLDEATGKVTLRHYDATPEGMVQSWADRADLV